MNLRRRSIFVLVVLLVGGASICLLWVSVVKKRSSAGNATDDSQPVVVVSELSGATQAVDQLSHSAGQPAANKPIHAGAIPTASGASNADRGATRLLAAYKTPISFYGKVLDESTNVVAGANVRFRVATDPNDEGGAHNTATGTEYHTMSDSNGLFSLTGVFGGTLTVVVSKDGFHSTDRSGRMFHYFDHEGILGSRPTQMEPAIFVLKRKQGAEPMISRRFRRTSVVADGTPAGVNFPAGDPSQAEVPDFYIQLWKNASSTNAQGQYDWSYKFSIPGGGLTDRKDAYEFQAPSDGYREVIEGAMVAGGDNWHTTIQRNFFGKLRNGCHVRFQVSLTTWGKGSFAIDAFFMNPAPGSRNLEYDPALGIK